MNSIETTPLTPSRPKFQLLSATAIKLIAAALMFADHIHQMFVGVGAPAWLTMVGRLVFPMFLFTCAEGFAHTRSKKKYLKRLLLASWAMTLFTFCLQRLLPNPEVILMNNAFSTFFVTGLYMLLWDWFMEGLREKRPWQVIKAVLCCFIPVLCALPMYLVALLSFQDNISGSMIRVLATLSLLVPNILTVEGGFLMVVLGVLFYMFRKHRVLQIAALLLVSALVYARGNHLQSLMAFAAIPMAMYNGERGRGMKHFFYIFYPAHIGLLYILATIL